jgi:spore germination cell wall hydrolase CwlJ-like protein
MHIKGKSLKSLISSMAVILMMFGTSAKADPLDCLAKAIYHEARGESETGQKAVAHVVVNRTRHNAFPNSICGVVYQRSQFSWVGQGYTVRTNSQAWRNAQRIAEDVLTGNSRDVTNGARYFWSTSIGTPNWARSKSKMRIGSHYFAR